MGNVTFQFQCSSESTNGTGVQGGQIPELIFYGPTAVTSPPPSMCASPIGEIESGLLATVISAANGGGNTGTNSGQSRSNRNSSEITANCDDLLGASSSSDGGPSTN